jgi:hypothetical protein
MKKIYNCLLLLLVFAYGLSGCKKLVDVNPPSTSLTGSSIYTSDATAISAVTALYTQLSSTSIYFSFGFTNLSLYAGLSSDEFTLFYQSDPGMMAYYTNALSVNVGGFEFWNTIYPYIYTCNAAIEGLSSSNSLTPSIKQQLMGEAKFMRAFFYFYLTNLYGDVPLALNSDYKKNALLPRTSQAQVYQQIISDLKDAEGLLSSSYRNATLLKTTKERVRPTKWAAMALLSRTYLYTKDWADAEAQADSLIGNTALYSLTDLNSVFLENSTEAIWQLQPVTTGITNTQDAATFIITSDGPGAAQPVYLSNYLLGSFEAGDSRMQNWVDSINVSGTTYYYPYKYKVDSLSAPVTEYIMMQRLGEQFLIRAEARAQQGANLAGAMDDLNAIRVRADLSPVNGLNQPALLAAIQHERQVELFTELGQRWLDLKRTGAVESVMDTVCSAKGGTWNSYKQLYPINLPDVQIDPNLKQNQGY